MKQRIKSGSWRTGRKKFSDRATKQKGLKKNEEFKAAAGQHET